MPMEPSKVPLVRATKNVIVLAHGIFLSVTEYFDVDKVGLEILVPREMIFDDKTKLLDTIQSLQEFLLSLDI